MKPAWRTLAVSPFARHGRPFLILNPQIPKSLNPQIPFFSLCLSGRGKSAKLLVCLGAGVASGRKKWTVPDGGASNYIGQ